MRKPSFSRQTGTTAADDESPTLVDGTAVPAGERTDASAVPMRMRHDDTTVTSPPTQRTATDRTATDRTATDRPGTDRAATEHPATHRTATDRAGAAGAATQRADVERAAADRTPTVAGPKPRASFLATLGLITAVVSALLVLSGPLAGYGLGLAVLALVLSIGGIRATRRRHVAGKTDALIGLVVALGAIVLGVLALTGSLSWLGTDTEPVSRVREWLDARFVNRF